MESDKRRLIYLADNYSSYLKHIPFVLGDLVRGYYFRKFDNIDELGECLNKGEDRDNLALVLLANNAPLSPSGLEIIEKYSRDYNRVPFIMFSRDENIKKSAIEKGAYDFFCKHPFDNEVFIKKVMKGLEEGEIFSNI